MRPKRLEGGGYLLPIDVVRTALPRENEVTLDRQVDIINSADAGAALLNQQ